MTFLSVLEVIALFLIAGAGWRCAHWLLKITYQVGMAGRDIVTDLTELRAAIYEAQVGTIGWENITEAIANLPDKGKAQKKRSK